MIKANELRIGNYVKYKHLNEISTILAIDILHISDDNSNVEPIPLTEEILLKCGAYYESILQDNDLMLIDIDENISIGYCGYLLLVIDGNPVFYGERNNNKLHQLQNLYYEIKGEELTIQL